MVMIVMVLHAVDDDEDYDDEYDDANDDDDDDDDGGGGDDPYDDGDETQIMKARCRLSEMDPSVLHKVFCRLRQSFFRHFVTVAVIHACAAQALHS